MPTQDLIQKSLQKKGVFVHLFTDDGIYRVMYENMFSEFVTMNRLSFGPHTLNLQDTQTVSAKQGRQKFERSTSAEQAAVEFTIMGLCDEFHGTSGSTVVHWVKWVQEKYNRGPHHLTTIGQWPAGGATNEFKKYMGEIVEKAVNHIIIIDDFTMVHEQANVLDFLGQNHLEQIYEVIVKALTAPPHHLLASDFIKQVLLKTCLVAKLNKDKYISASSQMKGNDDIKQINWFRALIKYRLKPFAMSLPSPAWWFHVTDKNVLQRVLIPPKKKHLDLDDSPPPWRKITTGSSSSSKKSWQQPEDKKRRLGK